MFFGLDILRFKLVILFAHLDIRLLSENPAHIIGLYKPKQAGQDGVKKNLANHDVVAAA